MIKRIIEKIFVSSAIAMAGVSLYAQTGGAYTAYSPYSIIGIGDINSKGTSFNRGMAGVGIATRNKGYINILNPAAVTARDTISFMAEMSLAQNNKYFAQDDINSANNTFNLGSVTMSFPLYRNSAMMVGVQPYSSTGYQYISRINDASVISQTGDAVFVASGAGGLNKVFAAAGMTFLNNISVGAEADFYFGNIVKNNSFVFSNTAYSSISTGSDFTMSGFGGKLGAQYEKMIGKNNKLGLGATYSLKSKMRGYIDKYEYAIGSTQTDTISFKKDTLHAGSGKVNIPSEIGIGISFNHLDRWKTELNYTRSDWKSSGMDVVNGFSSSSNLYGTGVSESLRFGFEIIPNANDIRYYYKRFAYRFGLYSDKAYYNFDYNDIRNTGITFGVSMPVYRYYNAVTFAVDLGQRSSLSNNLVRERYVNFTIGLNFFDYWFQKPQYD